MSLLKSLTKLMSGNKEELYNSTGDDDAEESFDDTKAAVLYLIMAGYGFIAGFIGCQFCCYLHQRFTCSAWGVPLTSRHIEAYSPASLVVDIVAVICVYGLILGVGLLLNRVFKFILCKEMEMSNEIANVGISIGFLFLILMSVISLLLPFNIFLIGV